MSTQLTRTRDLIDAISPSFCAAKWYNASIWLSNGRTASCHHPLAHFIPTAELMKNPSALHNTSTKKTFRIEMLEGKRPEECSYCWRVEDLNDPNIYSDRVYKSMVYSPGDIMDITSLAPDANVDPKNLEICFDNLCNMACSYCNSEFSSTWSSDIASNGPYKDMKTNGGHTYENDGQHGMPFGSKNEGNFYIKKFFDWFNGGLRKSLQELRVSGGEPTRSPDFWKLVDSFNRESFNFAVNTNLMIDEERLTKLINIKDQFRKFDIYTSGEAHGKNANFVRSGLDYDTWKKNLYTLQTSAPSINTHIMMTVSALSVWTIDKFLEDILQLRQETKEQIKGNTIPYHMSVNILRFPSFQSVNLLPQDIKTALAAKIEAVVESTTLLTELEKNNFVRCIAYLREVDKSYEDTDTTENKINDFKQFVNQYSTRRNMPIEQYMPEEFINWFNTL